MPPKRKPDNISPPSGNKEAKQRKKKSKMAAISNQNNGQVQTPTLTPTQSAQTMLPPGQTLMHQPVYPYGSPYLPMNVPQVSPIGSQQDATTSDALQTIIKRLESMDTKMLTLSSIEKTVQTISTRLNDMDQKISEIERSQTFLSEQYETVASSTNDNKQSIDKLNKEVQALTAENTNLKSSSESLREDVIDLKCRSMRDNLLFYGIPEGQPQQPQQPLYSAVVGQGSSSLPAADGPTASGGAEDCETKVLDFCEKVLKIENPRSCIAIDRAHRIGKFDSSKTRPIVAKFRDTASKMKVKNTLRTANLKSTRYNVSDQYPPEVNERRKVLLPVMHKARSENKRAVLVRDKLYINNRLYQPVDTPRPSQSD